MNKIVIIFALLISSNVFAKRKKAKSLSESSAVKDAKSMLQSKVEGSDASSGCGYGWTVTKGKSLSASSTRATTNSTASNTIAMTMGTSGCEKHSIVKADKEQEFYTEINYENILAEMAQGQGEYLTAFANVMGCSNVNAFANHTQANLGQIVADSPMALLKNVRNEIATNSAICL